MTPRSSGPGGEYAPLRGTTNLRLTANQHCKCNGKLRWRSCGHHFPSQPGRGSATDCLGHSRKADLVNFSQAPKPGGHSTNCEFNGVIVLKREPEGRKIAVHVEKRS